MYVSTLVGLITTGLTERLTALRGGRSPSSSRPISPGADVIISGELSGLLLAQIPQAST
ncbi:hypothetical protein [Streptomyces sp. NPDC057438]|uniref:hypothetical protein n=1 Tax=Streptomyces sp. NPDC057438 TaxID=3346133 RepID=UPI0036CBF478